MAVEILARSLRKPLKDMSGSDIAYDVHVRRVFLRTGLVERNDMSRMVAAARALNPYRPGPLIFRPGTSDAVDEASEPRLHSMSFEPSLPTA
jgi:hypothetical protein